MLKKVYWDICLCDLLLILLVIPTSTFMTVFGYLDMVFLALLYYRSFHSLKRSETKREQLSTILLFILGTVFVIIDVIADYCDACNKYCVVVILFFFIEIVIQMKEQVCKVK